MIIILLLKNVPYPAAHGQELALTFLIILRHGKIIHMLVSSVYNDSYR